MKLLLSTALFLLVATTVYTNPLPPLGSKLDTACPYGFSQPANSEWKTCYKIFTESDTRSGSAAECAKHNATLASVGNAFVNSYLNSLGKQEHLNSFWVGAECFNGDLKSCVNNDGSPFLYSNFQPGEPSTAGDCVYATVGGRENQLWKSANCKNYFDYVCQVPAGVATPTPSPPPPNCPGQNFYYGDLAILFEETYNAWGSQMEYAMHNFINFHMLTYANNPYRIDGNTSRILLVPYGYTDRYDVIQSYAMGPTSMEEIANRLEEFDNYVLASKTNVADINAGLLYVQNVKDHGLRVGNIIIMGSTAKYVNSSLATSKSLQQLGYNVFTINFNAINDLSPLASRKEYIYKREEAIDDDGIATSIGAQILRTSACDPMYRYYGYTIPRAYLRRTIEDIADELEGSEGTTKLWNIESANMNDGLSFVLNDAKSLYGNFSQSVILVGYSDKFVASSLAVAQQLKNQNYQVFTVSFNPDADFSPLSSGPEFSFTRKTEADEIGIARSIGNIINARPPLPKRKQLNQMLPKNYSS